MLASVRVVEQASVCLDMLLSDLNLVARATNTVKGEFKKILNVRSVLFHQRCHQCARWNKPLSILFTFVSEGQFLSKRKEKKWLDNRVCAATCFSSKRKEKNSQLSMCGDLFHQRWHRCDRWNKDQQFWTHVNTTEGFKQERFRIEFTQKEARNKFKSESKKYLMYAATCSTNAGISARSGTSFRLSWYAPFGFKVSRTGYKYS